MGYLTRTDIPVADYDAQKRRYASPEEDGALGAQPQLPLLALAAGPLAPVVDLTGRLFAPAEDQRTAYRYQRVRDTSVSERIARETAYDEFNDELFALTGQRLHNPEREAIGVEVDFERGQFSFGSGASGTGVERYRTTTSPIWRWHRDMAVAAASNPALADLFARSTRENALLRAEQIREERTLAFHEYLGDGDVIDQLVRGLQVAPGLIVGAISTSAPEQVAQLAAGGGGRLAGAGGLLIERVAARFGIGAAANIAAQAAIEPAIIRDAERMGEERTMGMVALDFTLAGILGGTLSTIGGEAPRQPGSRAQFELSGPSAREMRIARQRSPLRDTLTLPPVGDDVTPLGEPGSGQAVQNAAAGRAESLIVAAAQRDLATRAEFNELAGTDAFPVEALTDETLANDAYVRGDPEAAYPVRTEPTRRAEPAVVEAAARQADEAPPPPAGTREPVTMNGRVRPRTFERFPASSLRFDAATFQYKRTAGAQGATGRLEGVEVWDAQSAGKIVVWEAADGTRYVADGHQRAALAQSISARQGSDIPLDGYLYREADGWTAREVRDLAAQKNLRETAGDPLDTAALMRAAPDLIDSSIPQRSADFRMARSLARLSDEAFAAVRAGQIEPRLGAVIGEVAADRPEIHATLVEMFQRDPPATLREGHFIVREAMAVPAARMQTAQISLFDDPLVLSGMRERAEILRHAGALLREDKRVFVVAERHADALEAAGNVLAVEENARRADLAAALLRELDTLATRPGPVADALREIATRAAAEKTSARVAGQQFIDRVAAMLDERGLLGLYTDPPLREPPPAQLLPLEQRMEQESRAATLRGAHDRDTEALTQSMAEIALERSMRGDPGEVIPADALGMQRDADIARIEEAADVLGLAPDPGEIDVAAAILARADRDLADEARLRIEPARGEGAVEGEPKPATFADVAEQSAEIEAPWRPDEFDDAVKLREAVDAATLPELEAVARELGVDGEARTRAEYAALFRPGERGFFAKSGIGEEARAAGYEGTDTGEALEWRRAVAKGLPMDEASRMARARKMGFTTDAYRGLSQLFDEDYRRVPVGEFFSDTPEAANSYTGGRALPPNGGNVMPVRLRLGRSLIVEGAGDKYDRILISAIADETLHAEASLDGQYDYADTGRISRLAREAGYDSATFRNIRDDFHGRSAPSTVYNMFRKQDRRSRFAAFDPDFSENAGLLLARAAPAPSAPLATVAQLQTSLRSAFPRWADKLTERYRLNLVQSVSELPVARDLSRGSLRDTILGYAQGGEAWIVADNVSPEMLRGLTLHEIGVHVGMKEMLGVEGFARALGEVERLRFDDADIAQGYESAIRARTPDSQMAEEALAYAIQYTDPETMSTGLRGLIRRIANSVRAWLWRNFPGLRVADALTFEDMQWLALGGLRHAARNEPRYFDAANGRWASWDELERMLEERRRVSTPGLRRTLPPDIPEVGTPEYAAAVMAAREAQKSGQRLTDMQRALIRFEEGEQFPDGMFARGDAPERRSDPFHDPRLTPQQNKAVEMVRNGFTRQEIADEMDISGAHLGTLFVGARRKGVDVPIARGGNRDPRGVTTQHLMQMRESGLTPTEIAERTGVPYGSVKARISQQRSRLRREAETLEGIVRDLKDCR